MDGWGTVCVTGRTGGRSNGGYITTIKYIQDEYLSRERTFNLSQNYPNPFNGMTTIRYRLENASQLSLTIYNLAGQEVETLIHQQQLPGEYEVGWDARQAPSGSYIYRLQAKDLTASGRDFVEVRKLVLLK